MAKKITSADDPSTSPVQDQIFSILRGRPDHISIRSDDYRRVLNDIKVATAMLKQKDDPQARVSVMRMTTTGGLTYADQGFFKDSIPGGYVPKTVVDVFQASNSAPVPKNTRRVKMMLEDKELLVGLKLGYKPEDMSAMGQLKPGAQPSVVTPLFEGDGDPMKALNALPHINENAVVVIEDFNFFLTPQFPSVCIRFREILQKLRERGDFSVLVITVSPDRVLPENMKSSTICLDYPLPSDAELGELLERTMVAAEASKVRVSKKAEVRTQIRDNMRGLTFRSASTALTQSISRVGKLDEDILPFLIQERANMFRAVAGGAAEFIPPGKVFQMAGGVNFARWAEMQKRIADGSNRRVPLSRGVILVGPAGTGKTTYANWLSALMQYPIVKVPMGSLGGENASKIGAVSGAMRAILQGVQAVQQCIVLLDDVLKAVDSTDNAKRGGGTIEYLRAISTMLEWTENRGGTWDNGGTRIMLFGTGNTGDFGTQFPEGFLERFPVKFQTGMPDVNTRAQIFRLELSKFDLSGDAFDVDGLAQETRDWVGRQIRDITEAGVAFAYGNGEAPTTGHILECIRNINDDTVELGGFKFKMIDPPLPTVDDESDQVAFTAPTFVTA